MKQFIVNNWLQIAQLALSILLMAAILLQRRGSGLGASFGQDMASYSTKRGAEKFIFSATIVLAVLFFAAAFAHFFVK